MNFKRWLRPVFITGGIVLLLIVIIWSPLAKIVAKDLCPSSNGTLWIKITSLSGSDTCVAKGQVIGWMSKMQYTIQFDNVNCVNPADYVVNQPCPPGYPGYKCSAPTPPVQQPSVTGIGSCHYKLGGGLVDPRIIVIGK